MAGNAVQYRVTASVLADGRIEIPLGDAAGRTIVVSQDSNGNPIFPVAATPADGEAYGLLSKIRAFMMASNGTTTDMLRASLTAVQTAFTGMLNTLPYAKFNLTRPTLADTNGVCLQIDQYGNLKIVEQAAPDYEDNANDLAWTSIRACADALGAWTSYQSTSTKVGTAGISVKTTAGRIRHAYGINTHATNVYYLLLVDKASAPVANDVALHRIQLLPALAAPLALPGPFGMVEGSYFGTGVAYAISTTPEKVTLPGTSDCVVELQYA